MTAHCPSCTCGLALPDPYGDAAGAAHSDAGPAERAAAWGVLPRTGTQRQQVLDCHAESYAVHGEDGMTDDEVSLQTGLYRYSAAPRRYELTAGGWLEDAGATRRNRRGQPETVWRLTDRALRDLKLPARWVDPDEDAPDGRGSGG